MKKHTLYALIGLAISIIFWNLDGGEGTIIRMIGGFVLGWNLVDIFRYGL